MIVSGKDILLKACKEGYAIGAYNFNNLEFARYILEACNEDRSPCILAASESAINYMGGYYVVSNMIKSIVKELNIKVPVILHLDHGKSFESCKSAIDAGFSSVMIDASSNPIEKNIKITKMVKEYASLKNIPVEAELGSLEGEYTNLEECSSFISETKVDYLAPSIGNAHGIYEDINKLNFELLGAICKEVKIPLVLHGASGLDENKLKTAIFCGVAKININTDIQIAWSNSVKEYLKNNKEEHDPRKIIGSGKSAVKSLIHKTNEILGSKNRAF